MDRALFWQNRFDRFKLDITGREHIVRLNETKTGALLVGAHMGNMDVLRALSIDRNLNLHVIMHRGNAVKINRLMERLGQHSSVNIIEMVPGDMNTIFELKSKLEQGDMVALLGDRPAPTGKDRTRNIPFLGHDAPIPESVWILASIFKCPVYLTVGLRTGLYRYRILAECLAERVELPRRDRAHHLDQYMRRYMTRLEELCQEHPFQWFNFYDYWCDDG